VERLRNVWESKIQGFCPYKLLGLGHWWDLAKSDVWIDDDFVGYCFPSDENENAYVSTFGCCVTSACAPKRARRTAFKQEMK